MLVFPMMLQWCRQSRRLSAALVVRTEEECWERRFLALLFTELQDKTGPFARLSQLGQFPAGWPAASTAPLDARLFWLAQQQCRDYEYFAYLETPQYRWQGRERDSFLRQGALWELLLSSG